MDSFERRLKSLPLAVPSDGLRERIFGRPSRRTMPPLLYCRRLALGWAAVLALMTGLAGFGLGSLSGRASPGATSPQSNIEVRIVEAASNRHNFDLTATPPDFLTGNVRVDIEIQQEI